MHFLLPFILILLLLFRHKLKAGDRTQRDKDRLFWERESKANAVRKKDIEQLHYITIPSSLPHIDTDNSKINELFAQIEDMRSKRILNLTGMSNTDLKLEYGASNLAPLSEYDNNFTELARLIAALGHSLIEENYISEAVSYLEFGIECGSDVSSNYVDLAKLYIRNGQASKVKELLDKADTLNSLSKNIIIQKLQAL